MDDINSSHALGLHYPDVQIVRKTMSIETLAGKLRTFELECELENPKKDENLAFKTTSSSHFSRNFSSSNPSHENGYDLDQRNFAAMEGSNLQFLRQSSGKCEDRLSFLPESILHHILSFLPTKCAVGTSILATRWRYHWTSVPILDFSDDLLRSTTRSYKDPLLKDKFTSFVYRVLLLHDSDIHRFCLTCSHTYHASHFNAWVSAVLKRKVKELVIKMPSGLHSIGLHNYLFRCGSLAILHIKGVREKLPALISFSSLKVLHLYLTRFYWDGSVEQVTFNLPVLEEFRMENSVLWNVNIIVFAPLLMSLYIYEKEYDFRDCFWNMKICAENLISLTMISRCLRAYYINCLPTLVDASKYLVGTRELFNVKDLVVSSDIVEDILKPELALIVPKLFKVTNLGVINGYHTLDGNHFVNLLCQVPNIESLVFPDGLTLGLVENMF
ncbi:hypothetical protein IFM89_036170 [Coptis chinensis]|uniref:F-box domain-containing protein n=1 Tax=Coptis chinensis TaxID=261450 RepID=A0A835LCQ9_9MAGN|nr:hypothetical protein IFM89_036170 [Coptis chinensis]